MEERAEDEGGGEEENTKEEIRTETEKKKNKRTDLTEHGEVSCPAKWRLSKSSEDEDRHHKHKHRQGLEKLHDDGLIWRRRKKLQRDR